MAVGQEYKESTVSTSNHTINYDLPLWEGGDKTSWLEQVNDAMNKIDDGIHEAKNKSLEVVTIAEEARKLAEETKAESTESAEKVDTFEGRMGIVEKTIVEHTLDITNLNSRAEQQDTELHSLDAKVDANNNAMLLQTAHTYEPELTLGAAVDKLSTSSNGDMPPQASMGDLLDQFEMNTDEYDTKIFYPALDKNPDDTRHSNILSVKGAAARNYAVFSTNVHGIVKEDFNGIIRMYIHTPEDDNSVLKFHEQLKAIWGDALANNYILTTLPHSTIVSNYDTGVYADNPMGLFNVAWEVQVSDGTRASILAKLESVNEHTFKAGDVIDLSIGAYASYGITSLDF